MFHITFLDTMLTLTKQYSISDFKVEYLRDLMVNWADATNWMSFDLTLLPDHGNLHNTFGTARHRNAKGHAVQELFGYCDRLFI